MRGDKQKAHIEWVMKIHKIKYEKEYLGLKPRKYRFDWIVLPPELKIAIEYEGIFSAKSRHTNVLGYTGDIQKYNLAVIKGWKVLRYTAKNLGDFENDILTLMLKNESTK